MGKRSRKIRDRRENKHIPQRFRSMDTPTAVKECGRPYDKSKVRRTPCPVCTMNVILHCTDCEIQITGCLCTAIDRMDPREYAEFRQMVREKQAKESGLILPTRFN